MHQNVPEETSRPAWLCYEDRHLLIANKPAGLLAVADDSAQDAFSLWVKAYYAERLQDGQRGYCEPMHQLDKVTAGLLLFALSGKAAERIGKQFVKRSLGKTYHAVVTGPVPPVGATVLCQDFLAKVGRQVQVVSAKHTEAKKAELSVTCLAKQDRFSLVSVELHTGRTHQIRVQLSHRGWPIVGDTLYGSSVTLSALSGIALLARELTLEHPVSKSLVQCEAPYPIEWLQLWPRLLANQPSKNHR
jgi:23S rRNA pseudouridine1911/1915/1917 synthase